VKWDGFSDELRKAYYKSSFDGGVFVSALEPALVHHLVPQIFVLVDPPPLVGEVLEDDVRPGGQRGPRLLDCGRLFGWGAPLKVEDVVDDAGNAVVVLHHFLVVAAALRGRARLNQSAHQHVYLQRFTLMPI
jgi:hypothetical protein